MPVRVAVVGAGPIGLVSARNLKDDGFDVTLFETRSYVGGIWKYSTDSSLSVAENTTFNSSRFRIGISDFPVPPLGEMDDFPTGAQMHKYLEHYCEHFGLTPRVQFNSKVTNVRRNGDEWELEVVKKGVEKPQHMSFDKVLMACGTFVKARQPTFKGIEQFAGPQVHAMDFHDQAQFRDRNVLIVGTHASAQDVMNGLHSHGAKKVFLSHRKGLVILPRYSPDGSVYDRMPPLWFMLGTMYIGNYFPSMLAFILDTALGSMSKKAFPNIKKSWGFSPAPSVQVAPPVVITTFYDLLQSGYCEPTPEVDCVQGPKSIKLKDGRILEDIDAIVYATGYDTIVPVEFEPKELYPFKSVTSQADLYRGTFPLHEDPKIRNSLAFLCLSAVPFPGFSQFEMQALAISQIWQGRKPLPPLAEMKQWRNDWATWRETEEKRYRVSKNTMPPFLLPLPDHLNWLDRTAGLGLRDRFGFVGRWINWKAWKLWWNDRKLYDICLKGLTSPAIFRLFDEGGRKTWSGARAQVFIDNERVEEARKRRVEMKKLD